MNKAESRIFRLPSLKSDYVIVSMPFTTWYWLDDLVKKLYPSGGYKALARTFKRAECAQTLADSLRNSAQAHCDAQMAILYNLANDNTPEHGYAALKPSAAMPDKLDLSTRMPTVYQLFRFMPHATYLTTIWERRNYHLKGPSV